jgi:hypothetical protein
VSAANARVKIKVAAEQFPWYRFVGVMRRKGVWTEEEIGPEEAVAPERLALSLALDA